MLDEQTIAQLKSLLDTAQSTLVVVGEQASSEEVITAIGVHLALRNAGRESRIVSVKPVPYLPDKLPGKEEVSQEMGNENLTISFDYSEEQVDKVSYHIGEDTGKFYLTIKPKSGAKPLEAKSVEFNYTGASADLLILCGVSDPEELLQLYFGYENFYSDKPIITFGKKFMDQETLHLGREGQITAELWISILKQLAIPMGPKAATTFLYEIEKKTEGFTNKSIDAETFEMVASLLRDGAERIYSKEQQKQTVGPNVTGSTKPANTGKRSNKNKQKTSKQNSQARG